MSKLKSSKLSALIILTYAFPHPNILHWWTLTIYVQESEVLTPADDQHHIGKHAFKVPFVCGCKNLGEALRRISEGAAMIRTKGEAGTGDVVEAVRHQRAVMSDIRKAASMTDEELYAFAKELSAPYHLLKETARLKRLPVVSYVLFLSYSDISADGMSSFAAGGVATPADAALMMQLGCDGVFVGSGICTSSSLPIFPFTFSASLTLLDVWEIVLSGDPAKRARAIVQAVTHYNNPQVLAEISTNLGDAMVGISTAHEGEKIQGGRLAGRGN